MGDIALRLDGIGKQYRLGERRKSYKTFRETVTDGFRAFHSHRDNEPANHPGDLLWALREVSFEIGHGEVVGLIGRNGSGKSTLLKILSRITEPTEGRARVFGRVGSLLEVGTGFHPELTGRENVYLNGAILGMRQEEVRRRFDEIVAFAEIEKFIDTPAKRYSSGMYMRLAFAVAAHLEPEILLVDEVLAVGDSRFQKKCLGKMGAVAREGRTILFVSHNMQAVSTLTSRSVVLHNGKCIYDGETGSAITEYLRLGQKIESSFKAEPNASMPNITSVVVRTSEPDSVQRHGEALEIEIVFSTPLPISGTTVSFQVLNEMEQPIVHLEISDGQHPLGREPGLYHVICRIPNLRLYMGRYSLTAYLSEFYGGKRFDILENICPFEVVMYGIKRDRPWFSGTCVYMENAEWQVTPVVHQDLAITECP